MYGIKATDGSSIQFYSNHWIFSAVFIYSFTVSNIKRLQFPLDPDVHGSFSLPVVRSLEDL